MDKIPIFIALLPVDAQSVAAGAQMFPEDITSSFEDPCPVGTCLVYTDLESCEFATRLMSDISGEKWIIVELSVDEGRLQIPDTGAEKESMRFLSGGIRNGDFISLHQQQ